MAYDGFGKSVVSKYQEIEMEVAYRLNLHPTTVGYGFIGIGVAIVVAVVAGIILVS